MTQRKILAWTTGAIAVAALALIGTAVINARGQPAGSAQFAAKSESSAVPAGKGSTPPAAGPLQPGEIRYASQGVSMLPASPDAQPAHSQADALAAFKSQAPVINQFAQDIAGLQPDVELMNVTDTQPADGSTAPEAYLGWVIIYHGVPPVFYGGIGSSPPPDGSNMSCDLVGIQNAQTGEWTETFESCS